MNAAGSQHGVAEHAKTDLKHEDWAGQVDSLATYLYGVTCLVIVLCLTTRHSLPNVIQRLTNSQHDVAAEQVTVSDWDAVNLVE